MGDPRGTQRWRRLRKKLYERDRMANAPCWICGEPIEYRARPGTPRAWEPDHVRPVNLYPELAYDESNIRPAHASCNRARGKGGRSPRGDGTLGKPTRKW